MIDADTLKREHPVAEVIARHGVQPRRQGRALVALCPFHRETKPSFTVDLGAGLWYCLENRLNFVGHACSVTDQSSR